MAKRISEAASEKPKRGRPRDDDGLLAVMASSFPEVKTRRGLQNKNFVTRTIQVLRNEPIFPWFLDVKADVCKTSIMAELGRIGNDASLLEAASEICKRNLSSKESQALIRQWRGRKKQRDEAAGLRKAILKTINDYLAARPCTWDEVTDAVEHALRSVKLASKSK